MAIPKKKKKKNKCENKIWDEGKQNTYSMQAKCTSIKFANQNDWYKNATLFSLFISIFKPIDKMDLIYLVVVLDCMK